ncbi:hypothetical protein [Metapseudomonas otitidis]|uniref:hypothetical protein n=1 Tax=Metapseudomonas otitidis TaxID=319939 RepID=UPI00209B0190|nr:hypothetical protein [Pseudomonas otitidis]MCO7557341.1 hypothetical protein [Pseudomonas otitidis]
MALELQGKCPHCNADGTRELYVSQAEHDPSLIDLVVQCFSCERVLNEFVPIANMMLLTPGQGEVL